MQKKVVVITGSPRKDGNSSAMASAFIKAAEEKGHAVTRFDAAMKHLGGCHACETCYKTGKACSFDDDFNTIAPAILEADAVVFAMPVYWYSIPAQIKCVIDKLFSFCVALNYMDLYTIPSTNCRKPCRIPSIIGGIDTDLNPGCVFLNSLKCIFGVFSALALLHARILFRRTLCAVQRVPREIISLGRGFRGQRPLMDPNGSEWILSKIDATFDYLWSGHRHSVRAIWEKTASKEEASGEQA